MGTKRIGSPVYGVAMPGKQAPGAPERAGAKLRDYAAGAFAMIEMIRMHGIPDNDHPTLVSLSNRTKIALPPDYGDQNGEPN